MIKMFRQFLKVDQHQRGDNGYQYSRGDCQWAMPLVVVSHDTCLFVSAQGCRGEGNNILRRSTGCMIT